ncbi:hypothetical protein Sps_01444 [Shewanella psychrophila]|uniref:Uncharacterized protein n=1 Tax=Shewanella psychrophila TaxID=225848 RepID=A0A1S6HM69_9GAMM|nr:hypothetical protein [Shewanella psychrophila]AQS36610.1 hypothetical protein Sps_01444 [Shewanella psychrophila]
MKLLIILCCVLVSVSAFSVEPLVTEPAIDLVPIITALLGDKATAVIVIVSIIGFVWAQLRQLIPAEYMAKLPGWLIWYLELLAANKGKAGNASSNSPEHLKKWGG